MADHLWLIGMMGSGKSAVGRELAVRLGRTFIDTDDVVTQRMGCSISEFWGRHGEQAFRDMEAASVEEVAITEGKVIATGGGVVLRGSNVATMRTSGFVVWLQAEPATLAARVVNNTRRPLLRDGDPLERLADLLGERSDYYETAAHASVATDGLELDTVLERIEELWNAFI